MLILIYILAFFAIILFLWQASNLISIFFGSPYVKSKKKIVDMVLRSLNIKKDAIFYELGSGTGDVLIAAAKYNNNVTGIEISPFYYLYSKLRCLKYKNILIKYKNIFNIDLKKADVIYVYLLPKMLQKLASKFQNECKKNALIISLGFKIPNLKLIKKIKVDSSTIYIYKK